MSFLITIMLPGADPGFQVRWGAIKKKLRRAEGSTKIVGVFRVKNHDFTPKNLIFSNFRGGVHQCAPSGSTPGYTNFYLPPNVKYTETTMWSVSTV